jgi:beta-glucosidase
VQAVVAAVKAGRLDESALDEAVRRILGIVFRAAETPKGGKFDLDAHHALARKAAAEGMVLLKNDGLLPLNDPQHVAVIGRSAKEAHFQGGGSSNINPTRVAVPFKELQKSASAAEFTFAEGYPSASSGSGPADGVLQPALIDEAVGLAASADVALLYIALPSSKESEGYDRQDLDLTEPQLALIKAVSAVQPKTVVVLNNGAPLVMAGWIDGVAAVLEAWMMGQAGGEAIADVLFGRVNPSGKLAETFPLTLEDTPAYLNWPGGDGRVRYGEGLFIGYRWYDARQMPVQFPFGYGLSYTTFEYSHPKVSAKTFKDAAGITITVDVTNTGKVAGKEIVQVYVHDRKSSLARPVKELKGFAKVALEPGETKSVSVPLDLRAFAYYHPAYGQWITEDGEFDILIGASAADIRGTLTVTLQTTLDLPCILDRESTVREWQEDRRGRVVFEPVFKQLQMGMVATMGSEAAEVAIGMDMLNFMLDMPLVDLLYFQEKNLPKPADEFVDDLLAQAHVMKQTRGPVETI